MNTERPEAFYTAESGVEGVISLRIPRGNGIRMAVEIRVYGRRVDKSDLDLIRHYLAEIENDLA